MDSPRPCRRSPAARKTANLARIMTTSGQGSQRSGGQPHLNTWEESESMYMIFEYLLAAAMVFVLAGLLLAICIAVLLAQEGAKRLAAVPHSLAQHIINVPPISLLVRQSAS